MCMTEQSELAYQAMDETAEWGAKNIIHLRRVHELEPHVMPEHTTGSVWRDFSAFWDLGRVPAALVVLLCIAIVFMLAGWAYQELRMADWGVLLAAVGGAV